MKFSVLLPVYIKDSPVFFSEAILSLYQQTIIPDEIVIIKDGPIQKEINDIILNFKNLNKIQIVEFQFEKNVGMGTAFAKGVTLCKNELIARMDADDISVSKRFELQLEQFKNNLELSICGGWLSEFEIDFNKSICIKKVPERHSDIFLYSKKRNPFNHPTVMFKKSDCIKVGNYMPKKYYEDYNLWVRMLLNNCKGYNIQDVLCHFRTNDDFYKRRGDKSKLKDEVLAIYEFYKMKHINFLDFISKLLIRVVFRLIPNYFRKLIYTKFLRN
jgi:UDP-Gal:alpha-D-GlcNAc-diphosphoundecaprenol beta-1,3-galactosyltransferase